MPSENSLQAYQKNNDFVFILTGIIYSALKILIFYNYPIHYHPIADASLYILYSKLSLFSRAFYDQRPFIYPLFLKILHDKQSIILCLQCLISIISWLCLSFLLYRQWKQYGLKSSLFCFYGILLFSLNLGMSQWDNMILTESLTISCFALWYFILLSKDIHTFSPGKKLSFLGVSFLLFHLRDANAYFLIMLIPFFIYTGIKTRQDGTRLFCFLAVLFYTANFSFAVHTANAGSRWWFSMGNILTERLAPDFPDALDVFVAKGMPETEKTFLLQNQYTMNGHEVFYREVFHDETITKWSAHHLKGVYFKYLMMHPALLFRPLFFDGFLFSHALDPPALYIDWYGNPKIPLLHDLLRALNNSLFAISHFLIVGVLLMAIYFLLHMKQIQQASCKKIGILLYLFLLIFPTGTFIWHADAIEIKRHFLILYQTVWILFIFLCDEFFYQKAALLRK